jgi:hypothetical protein
VVAVGQTTDECETPVDLRGVQGCCDRNAGDAWVRGNDEYQKRQRGTERMRGAEVWHEPH